MKRIISSLFLAATISSPVLADYKVLLLGDSLFDNPVRPGVPGDIDQTWSFNTWFTGAVVHGKTLSGVANFAIGGTGLFYSPTLATSGPNGSRLPGAAGYGLFALHLQYAQLPGTPPTPVSRDNLIDMARLGGTEFAAAIISYGVNDVTYLAATDAVSIGAYWNDPTLVQNIDVTSNYVGADPSNYVKQAVDYLNYVATKLGPGAPILWMMPHLEVSCGYLMAGSQNFPYAGNNYLIQMAIGRAAAYYNAQQNGHPVSLYWPDAFLAGHYDGSAAQGVPCTGAPPGTVRYIMGPPQNSTNPDIHFTPLGKSYMPYYLLARLQQ